MPKQKKFSSKEGSYEGVDGVSEFAANFLPDPQSGIKKLEAGFETIWEYEKVLDPLVKQARKGFNQELKNSLKPREIKKINSGLEAYISSSTKSSFNLTLLKASILNSIGVDPLKFLYDQSDDSVKQMIPDEYFENLEELKTIDESWLIKSKSIKTYRYLAAKYTAQVLENYVKQANIAPTQDLDDLLIYRGMGNSKYYKNNEEQKLIDFISVFTAIGEEGLEYFERQLLTSYTINSRVAEIFMVYRKNSRRAFISANFTTLLTNLFSSFVVSDLFSEGQYELLCIPNTTPLYIREDVNDTISAEFHLSSSLIPYGKLRRNPDYEEKD
jgi:hypothetical protein